MEDNIADFSELKGNFHHKLKVDSANIFVKIVNSSIVIFKICMLGNEPKIMFIASTR